MDGASNKRNSTKISLHLVLICDQNGIHDAFKAIKDHLGNGRNIILSLIYAVPKDFPNPLFVKELSILEKRFSGHLFTYILKIEPGEFGYIQEFIEAIINSNIILRMQFSLFGNEVFVKYFYEVLQYLNGDTCVIEIKVT